MCVCACVDNADVTSCPPGAYFWLLFLPAWVLFVILQVNLADPSLSNAPPPLPPLHTLWDPQALGLVLLWVAFQALLYILPIGKVGVSRWSLEKLELPKSDLMFIDTTPAASP